MKLSELFALNTPTLSFEVFPPKTNDSYASVEGAVEEIAKLKPAFMSVTYGAGGGTSDFTVSIAKGIAAKGVTPLAHLTCVSSSIERIDAQLDALKTAGIENILALRGDMPQSDKVNQGEWSFRHASELTAHIKSHGDFCIGGACYPEIHPESETQRKDIEHLKKKVDAGCEFLTTQMFFDNNIFYNFLYKTREAGINVPIVAGIMPVTAAVQMRRIFSMTGTALPRRFRMMLDHFGENPIGMKQAGIIYAAEQIADLVANDINHIHVYSMNKPEIASAIQQYLAGII